MPFEKRDATQIATFAPPLPQRAFWISDYGSTDELTGFAGSAVDGVRYGYVTINTNQFSTGNGKSTPPMQTGEAFQIWTSKAGNGFLPTGAVAMYSSDGAVDLFKVRDITNGVAGGAASTIQVKFAKLMYVVGTRQNAANSWTVYYSEPVDNLIDTRQDGVVTIPLPYNGKWLGQVGHVAGVNYGFSLPGGPDQLTCTLQVPPDYRTDAMNPGRVLQAFRGGSCVWEGTTTEPQAAATGWTITANGVGTYGTNFGSYYDKWNADDPVNKAIGRGLRWKNPGIGSPSGIYLGAAQDPGSMTVTDFLNLICTGGGLTWNLVPSAGIGFPAPAWMLQVVPFPTDISGNPLITGSTPAKANSKWLSYWRRSDILATAPRIPPDLYLINTSPISRTISNDYNTVILRYQISADIAATSKKKAQAARYGTTVADIPSSVAAHGRLEYYLDITNAGTMTEAAAVKIGKAVLQKYIRASFGSSFTVQPGQLVNNGGVPVDLGCNWGGRMVTVQVNNDAFGGEVNAGPITFFIGEYVYDEDTQTATITPYQAAATDLNSVIAELYPGRFA